MPITPRRKDPEAELALLREKVEALMAERVSPAMQAIAGEAEAAAREAAEGVRARMRDGAGEISERVRERPLAAIGLALLTGAALFAMIRR